MDGEVELNGKHYNFVKSRVNGDTVEYLCIPNQVKTKLSNARDNFYKLVNDLQHPSQNKKSDSNGSFKNMLSEYYEESNSWSLTSYAINKAITSSLYIFSLSNPSLSPSELPPDAC